MLMGTDETTGLERNAVKKPRASINKQINKLLGILIFPMLGIIVVLLAMLASINREYAVALQNANAAAEFNNNFKYDLDLAMWYHVINASTEDELPWDEVNRATEVLNRLQETTTQSDNRWRIRSMLNMCNNLSGYMVDIANTKYYDDRMQKLENNVNSITGLIESYMLDYIYDEVKELTRIQNQINSRVLTIVIMTLIISMIILVTILGYSLRFARRITQPISELCKKVQKLGGGDFSVEPIETRSVEIQNLDNGFNEMAGRIDDLMKREIEDQKALYQAEFELLQSQINPHFLYNTLDSIVWLAETRRDSDVVKMVTSLSIFFRNSLSNGRDVITLEEERDQVKSYLEIQKIRYSDILDYSIDIPKELLKYAIPKLTLQPLVENAIYHGIKHKRAVGEIVISGSQEENAILLSVRDNGAGMTEEQLEELRASIYENRTTGLGLINVHKRIKLYCGDDYGLFFESVKNEGATVVVKISKKIQPIS